MLCLVCRLLEITHQVEKSKFKNIIHGGIGSTGGGGGNFYTGTQNGSKLNFRLGS